MPLSGAERTARYRAKNKEACAARTKRWIKNNPEKYKEQKRRNHLKRSYGITPDQYSEMWKMQGFVCAICKRDDPADHKKGWHLDHCHKTKKVRAILCGHCYRMLGGALDNVETLKSAISYLEGFNRSGS